MLGLGLDVRSGGGYVVGPGSILPEGAKDGQPGGVYKWVGGSVLKPVPAELTSRLVPRQERDELPRDSPVGDAAAVTDDRFRNYLVQEAPTAFQGSGGDHITFVVAAHLKDLGLSQQDAFDLMVDHWNERCEPPWALEDLQTKVANAYRYGENPPGSKAPETAFGDVKIEPPVQPPREPSKWFRHGMKADRSNRWLFFEVAPQLGVGVLVGETQAGKTFLEIELARCGATGKPFFGVEPVHKFGTLFVFAGTEGSDLALRLEALQEDSHLPISATYVSNLSRPGALAELLEDMRSEAACIMETFGVRVGCVVVETLAASGLLPRENDAGDASLAMHNLATIANEMGVFVLASHHPAKGTQEMRGSGAVPAAADYVITIKRTGKDKVRQVELSKARSAEQRALGSFTLVPVDLGLDDAGNPMRSLTVSMGDPIRERERTPKHAGTVIQAMEFSTIDLGLKIDGRNVCLKSEVVNRFKELTHSILDSSNLHRAFHTAFEFLEGQGVIEVIEHNGATYLCRQEIFT